MNKLTIYDKGKAAIEQARTIGELKDIRNQAEALRRYAQASGKGLEAQNRCCEIKLRAERKAGKLLKDQIPHQGGRPVEKPLHDERVILADAGISEIQSYRWQREAAISEADFEA